MANTYTLAQKQAVIQELIKKLPSRASKDRSSLIRLLNDIRVGNGFSQDIGGEQITLTQQETWDLVSAWCSEELGLSIGDRGAIVPRIDRILRQITDKVELDSIQAGAKYRIIQEQAAHPITQSTTPSTDPTVSITQKALNLRRIQMETMQAGLIGKLNAKLVSSDVFKNADPMTRIHMLQMIAASNNMYRTADDFTPDKLAHQLGHEANEGKNNLESHGLFRKSAKADFIEVSNIINQTIQEEYHGDESGYEADMAALRATTSLSPSLSDVDWMVNNLNLSGTPAQKTKLVNAIRSEILTKAKTGHVDGKTIILDAITRAGLDRGNLAKIEPLSPYFEEMRLEQTGKLLGKNLQDKRRDFLSTLSFTTMFGVDVDAPWLSPHDLKVAQDAITAKYGVNTLVEAYGQAKTLDELSQIKNLMNMASENTRYREALRGHPLMAFQDAWAKTWHRPINPDRFSIFDPLAGISRRWTSLQTNIAINIHDWAINVNGTSWFSGFAGHIADFTEGFTKHGGDWSSARHFFVERKWGNVLDWAAKKAGHESMSAAKAAFWKSVVSTIEIGGNKLAAGLGSKIATTLSGLITSEAGIGLGILAAQVIWETLKFGFNKIKQFFNDSEFRNKIINRIPLMVGGAVSGLILGLTAMVGAVPAFLAGSLGTMLLLLQAAILSLASLIALASALSLGAVATIMVVLFVFSNPTTQTDSGTALQQVAVNLLCDNDSAGMAVGTEIKSAGSSVASCANCLAKYLAECYGQSVTRSNISQGLSCLAARAIAPEVVEEIRRSAVGYTYLQCVGFVQASLVCGGATRLGAGNACDFINSGSGFTSGSSGARVGSVCMLASKSGACTDEEPGHIFIVNEDKGALVGAADANNKLSCGASGCVSSTSVYPKSSIAGCLVNK